MSYYQTLLTSPNWRDGSVTWWRHQMDTFSVLLAICAGNLPVAGEFPSQRTSNAENVSFDDVIMPIQFWKIYQSQHVRQKEIHSLMAGFRGPTWGPYGVDRTQVGPMVAPWTLLSGFIYFPNEIQHDNIQCVKLSLVKSNGTPQRINGQVREIMSLVEKEQAIGY